ncbi:molybdopterin-dependent oxidoreductase [Salipiger abyssi]|uniref:molybdopterin-dependent oxidoreductase n=1 Tax=Salipiger abyssi TaxID=1250539 RepID=UPI0009782D4F|nr:molybdopterin-dependent oxidoreductase [Salipiger abyssi]
MSSDIATQRIVGIVDVVPMAISLAEFAETSTAATAGYDALDVTRSATSPLRSADSASKLEALIVADDDMLAGHFGLTEIGDLEAVFTDDNVVASRCTTEHVDHAQMEPLNTVASFSADELGAKVWLGSQWETVSIGLTAWVLGTIPDCIQFYAVQTGATPEQSKNLIRNLLRDALPLLRASVRPVMLVLCSWASSTTIGYDRRRSVTPTHCRTMTAALQRRIIRSPHDRFWRSPSWNAVTRFLTAT